MAANVNAVGCAPVRCEAVGIRLKDSPGYVDAIATNLSQVCCNGVNITRGIFESYPNCFAPVVRHDFAIPRSANEVLAMSEHLLTLLAERVEEHTQREQP